MQGQPRPDVRRHWFGANFRSQHTEAVQCGAAVRKRSQTNSMPLWPELRAVLAQAATVTVRPESAVAGRLMVDVEVTNLTGHKLPTTILPSFWLHVVVRDRSGATVFESGALTGQPYRRQ